MQQPLVSQRIALALLAGTIILPIAICVILGIATLLATMGDHTGGSVLGYVALACGIVWVVNLICLVLALAINAMKDQDKSDGP
jgi:hypothetical protein